MKIGWTQIRNYSYFCNIFDSYDESVKVQENLRDAIQKDIENDMTAHVKLQYWVHYDDEGLAGFEIVNLKIANGEAYVTVEFISTAK